MGQSQLRLRHSSMGHTVETILMEGTDRVRGECGTECVDTETEERVPDRGFLLVCGCLTTTLLSLLLPGNCLPTLSIAIHSLIVFLFFAFLSPRIYHAMRNLHSYLCVVISFSDMETSPTSI